MYANPRGGSILDISTGMARNTWRNEPAFEANRRGPAGAAREFPGKGTKKPPHHVLVVDDEPLIRWSVTETLAELGLDAMQADCAAAALRAITTTALPFDVIVSDLRLPDMTDLSMVATIRQLLPETPLVLMTAFSTPEIIAEARRLGVRAVLHKPFELGELVSLVMGQLVGHTGAFSQANALA
jgi:DNA-binding NtrC family response regulator